MAKISFLEFQICAICQKGTIDGLTHPLCRTRYRIDGIISSIAYKGIVKKLVYQFKYHPYLSDLKGIMAKLMYEGVIQQEVFSQFVQEKNVLVAAVPLHKNRLKSRGYNQSELLGKELARLLDIEYISNCLIRKVDTKPQFKLSKKERKDNILGAFAVNEKVKTLIKNKRIILVDDISTTGSTLRECGKILKKSGAIKVMGITLTHEG